MALRVTIKSSHTPMRISVFNEAPPIRGSNDLKTMVVVYRPQDGWNTLQDATRPRI
jgi:hypothetical protein